MTDFARQSATRIGCGCLVLLLTLVAQASTNLPASRVAQLASWLSEEPTGLGRPITDRSAWEKLAQTASFAAIVPRAESLA